MRHGPRGLSASNARTRQEGGVVGGILFVCEGNLCRSPYAELVSKDRLRSVMGSRIGVSSAGIRAQVGSRVPDPMARHIREQGVDPSMHRARQLDREMIADASLVLAADGAVRSAVVHVHPPSLHYVFTIRHLERALTPIIPVSGDVAPLFEVTAADSVSRVVEVLRRGSGLVRDVRQDDDVIDPYGGSKRAYRQAVAEMQPALNLLVRSFGADGLSPVAAAPTRSRLAVRSRRRRGR